MDLNILVLDVSNLKLKMFQMVYYAVGLLALCTTKKI